MSTIVRTATIPGFAQGFEPMAKNVTPQAAGQTTGGTQQNVLSAYQTTSLQGLHPGTPPVSTQPQPTTTTLPRALGPNAPTQGTTGSVAGDPTTIHPDLSLGEFCGSVFGLVGAVLGGEADKGNQATCDDGDGGVSPC